jgi:hypothetical protein
VSNYQDPNDFLFSGGAPVAKFPSIGAIVKGTVTNSEVTQQTDIDQKPKFFDDGNPMRQLVITLQTAERDPSADNDDGLRRLFVKGQMLQAVREALKAAGSKLENGGTLAVQYANDKPSERRGYNDQKIYRAQYQPPAAGSGVNDLLGGNAAQPVPVGVASDDII